MPSIDPLEQAARAQGARRARHSTEMEGGRTSDAARAIQDMYVSGEIGEDEAVRRTAELDGSEGHL